MVIALGKFQTEVKLSGAGWSTGTMKNKTHMTNTNKIAKRNLSESDSENEIIT